MKLTNINNTVDRSYAYRVLLGEHHDIVNLHNNPSVSFQRIFLESVVYSDVLTEQEMDVLGTILQTGLSAIRNMITPGSSKDLEALLVFMAPDGGGVRAVNKLIDDAKTSPDLHSDEKWWNSLFKITGIDDWQSQKQIQYQVAQEFGKGIGTGLSLPGYAPRAKSEKDEVRSELDELFGDGEEKAKKPSRKKKDSLKDLLDKEESSSRDYQDNLRALLRRSGKARDDANKKMQNLHARLDALLQKKANESVLTSINQTLLETRSVQENIQFITNLVLKRTNQLHNTQFGVIAESDILDRIRTALANPSYATGTVKNITDRHDNTRAAKLAVRLATEHLRKKFATRLHSIGMLPDDIIRTYQNWHKLRTSGGDPNIIASLEKKLHQVFQLFGNIQQGTKPATSPTQPVEPENDELVDPLDPDQLSYTAETESDEEELTGALPGAKQQAGGNSFEKQVAVVIYNTIRREIQGGGSIKQITPKVKQIIKRAKEIDSEVSSRLWRQYVAWVRRQQTATA